MVENVIPRGGEGLVLPRQGSRVVRAARMGERARRTAAPGRNGAPKDGRSIAVPFKKLERHQLLERRGLRGGV